MNDHVNTVEDEVNIDDPINEESPKNNAIDLSKVNKKDIINNIKRYYIYKYTSPSGKVYIGQACQTREQRAQGGRGYTRCPLFYRAIEKYGYENFKYEILESKLTADEANEKEIYWISYYDSTNHDKGYNLMKGGSNNTEIFTDEVRKKISEGRKKYAATIPTEVWHERATKGVETRRKNGYVISEETRKKISESNKGRVLSTESREKISDTLKGHPVSNETKEKIKKAHQGKPLSDETKKKLNEAQKGRNCSDETKEKIRKANLGKKFLMKRAKN